MNSRAHLNSAFAPSGIRDYFKYYTNILISMSLMYTWGSVRDAPSDPIVFIFIGQNNRFAPPPLTLASRLLWEILELPLYWKHYAKKMLEN